MAEKVIMPKAGMSMETGTIIKWLKEVGDKVEYGEPILEIETDKTSMQVEAMNDGYLLSKLYEAGAEVPVVTTIGYIGEKGETPPVGDAPAAAASAPAVPEVKESAPAAEEKKTVSFATGGKLRATPAAKRIAREKGIDLATVATNGEPIKARDLEGTSAKVKATPLAKRVAEQNGIDISTVTGSGFGGKVKKDDVLAMAGTQTATQAQVPTAEDVLMPLNGMRKTIAKRMLESHNNVPPVTLNTQADVTGLFALRKQMNDISDVKISFNDLVVKACAVALREFPNINASYTEEGVLYKKDINIGIAVALDDGLIVPVLRNADNYSLKGLASAAKDMAARAREGKLLPDEYTGGTFTISNLGMFGIQSFDPIINMPEACILGVCAITDQLMMEEDGGIKNHKKMGFSLTFDHRCVDGASGAKFLQRVVQLMENPLGMLI